MRMRRRRRVKEGVVAPEEGAGEGEDGVLEVLVLSKQRRAVLGRGRSWETEEEGVGRAIMLEVVRRRRQQTKLVRTRNRTRRRSNDWSWMKAYRGGDIPHAWICSAFALCCG